MPELGSSSVTRRRLAAELRHLREERNLTEVARSLGWSASKLSRIELARIGVKPRDLSRLLDLYGVPAAHKAELLRLTERPRSRGWWEPYTDSLPEQLATYIVMESQAESISAWSPEFVPGLLQTPDYARAITESHMRSTSASPDSDIDRLVQTRLKRQRILVSDPPTRLTCVLDQSVLLRRQLSAQVMHHQLAHLIEMSALDAVTLRVLPLDGTHPIGTGAFVLLQFAPIPEIGRVSDIVYIEELTGSALHDDDSETHQYRLGFDRLLAESLDQDASRALIERAMRDVWPGARTPA